MVVPGGQGLRREACRGLRCLEQSLDLIPRATGSHVTDLDPSTPGSFSPSFHLPRHLTKRDPPTRCSASSLAAKSPERDGAVPDLRCIWPPPSPTSPAALSQSRPVLQTPHHVCSATPVGCHLNATSKLPTSSLSALTGPRLPSLHSGRPCTLGAGPIFLGPRVLTAGDRKWPR